ncbi:MAG TPA: CAP domain-containing protein [Myxococcota bacterium]|nr:CAP domain-containing protein [Myxococcota bacterium]
MRMLAYPTTCLLLCTAACGVADATGLAPTTLGDAMAPVACDGVADWEPAWMAAEARVLELVNEARAAGATCGDEAFPPAPPVKPDVRLQCAARVHSQDMGHRAFFSHENPDGEQAWDRLRKMGYAYSTMGENIAWGQATPEAVLKTWLESPPHCKNIMTVSFEELGVGYYPKDDGHGRVKHYWTQDFGAPPAPVVRHHR